MQSENNKDDTQKTEETAYFSPSPPEKEHQEGPAYDPAVAQEQSTDVNAQEPQPHHDPTADAVQWQSAEYHHSHKSIQWFVAFGVVCIGLIAVAVLLLRSWDFAVLIVVMSVALGLYAQRPPRMVDYALDSDGLYINDTLHRFGEYKAFGVFHDGAEYSVTLIPVKRFSPEVTVFFPESSGEVIVDALGGKLPMQSLKTNVFDKIVRFLGI